MSSDLQWLLLRKSNSYMVKGLPEGPIFSKEPGNLLNIHSHKYSGLANAKTIDVSDVNGKITITTHKTKVSPRAVAPVRSTFSVRSRSGTRRALGIASSTAKRGYRPDLRKVSERLFARICGWAIYLFCSLLNVFFFLRYLSPYLYSSFHYFIHERTLVRTRWINTEKWYESWAWTCLQDQSNSI
ncbi:ribosomal L28e protein family-domain-containing protein [Lentinula edodes]|uniref:ribosomal L28e protein family-domain-containing protein n=1 Tax=Lentinula edodes TaxID=5353 RepID=UPI001E8E9CC2|nr:ribosomal L28e protein family-domain-containing protein [Lentinula edodes]KAH7880498.1 ribosomal L28e protein family-domain-containing protein [Lentinula edodes]